MFSKSTTLFFVLSALSLVTASPMARSTCSPDFEGASVSVVANDVEWSASVPVAGTPVLALGTATSPPGTLYNFEETGSSTPSYVIKDVRASANNIAVAVGSDNILSLAQLTDGDATQIFSVSCNTCESNISQLHGTVATGCHISQTSTGLCVEVFGSANGDGLFLTDCGMTVLQTFNFVTQ